MDRREYLLMAATSVVLGSIASLILIDKINRRGLRKRRRVWMKTRNPDSQEQAVFNIVENELRVQDESSFINDLTMNKENFDELLGFVSDDISKTNTHMRAAISPKDRLSLTLRFLATGESYKSLMHSTKIHYSTISKIIPEVCKSIYINLKKRGYLKLPKTEEEWKEIAYNFEKTWNYPLCLGSIDGKHIAFRHPSSAGSYNNYKGFHSLVLLAIVDSNYRFIYADAEINGQTGDGGVFGRSTFFKALEEGKLNIPRCTPLPGRETPIPYHFIGNDALSLNPFLMKPYPLGNLAPNKVAFNARLSRARIVVEKAFGILSNRFRIFSTTINLPPEKVELIILTCIALHNFLATKNSRHYIDSDYLESKLTGLSPEIGHNAPTAAKIMREEISHYFNQNMLEIIQ